MITHIDLELFSKNISFCPSEPQLLTLGSYGMDHDVTFLSTEFVSALLWMLH
jgi:hypothetical protein